jgi:hypothetical protein
MDDEWRTGMPPIRRWLVTALTLPLLLRYRYPIRAGTGPAALKQTEPTRAPK